MQTSSKPSVAEVQPPVKVSEQKLVTVDQPGSTGSKREELVWKRIYWQHQMDLTAQMIGLLDQAILDVEIRLMEEKPSV